MQTHTKLTLSTALASLLPFSACQSPAQPSEPVTPPPTGDSSATVTTPCSVW